MRKTSIEDNTLLASARNTNWDTWLSALGITILHFVQYTLYTYLLTYLNTRLFSQNIINSYDLRVNVFKRNFGLRIKRVQTSVRIQRVHYKFGAEIRELYSSSLFSSLTRTSNVCVYTRRVLTLLNGKRKFYSEGLDKDALNNE